MNRLLSVVALAAVISVAACSAPSATSSVPTQTASSAGSVRQIKDGVGGGGLLFGLLVDLLDAPLPLGPGSQVNVALVGVNVVAGGVAYPLVTYSPEQVVNLLTLQQVGLPLQGSVPAGTYTSLELIVDPSNSSVVANGQTYPMRFASGSSQWGGWNGPSGQGLVALSAPIAITGSPGSSMTVAVDFNVLESVSLRHNSAWVKANLVVASQPATVSGVVDNSSGQPVVGATVVATSPSGNVVNTTLTASDGTFTLHALGAGAYTLSVLNEYTSVSGNLVTASGNDIDPGPTLPIDLAPSDQLNVGTLTD
jgi:hypothetical protein